MTVEQDAELVAAMATMIALMGKAFGIDEKDMAGWTMTMAYGVKKWRESGMSLGNWMYAAKFPAPHQTADAGMEAFRSFYLEAEPLEKDEL